MALLGGGADRVSAQGRWVCPDPGGGEAPAGFGVSEDQSADRVGELFGRRFLSETRIRDRRAHLDEQAHRYVRERRCIVSIEIVTKDSPDPKIRAALSDLMLAFNEGKTGPSGFAPFALVLQDSATGETVGGLWGRTVYDWMIVELLI